MSGDIFCEVVSEVIGGEEGVIQLIDDVLVCHATRAGLIDKVDKLLKKFKEKGATLSPSKFKIDQVVTFGGFLIDATGEVPIIKQDPAKLKDLADIEHPKNVDELRRFLGIAQQLSTWAPDYAHTCTHLRGLLRKQSVFDWSEDCEREFKQIKDILNNTDGLSIFMIGKKTGVLVDASRTAIGYILFSVEQ